MAVRDTRRSERENKMPKRLAAVLLVMSVVAAACGDDNGSGDTAPAEDEAPVTGPASIGADDQSGDGTAVTVASVSLPTEGFVVIHADADGAPGPILGRTDLLPAGDSADVVVSLDTAIEADATVFPMAHVDANANGEYEFMPPDTTIDVPAATVDGTVAVLSIAYTVG